MRNRIFWGLVLVILGVLFMVGYQVDINVWNLIWPLSIIVFGVWILLIPFLSKGIEVVEETYSFPSTGVERVTIKLAHGAGSLNMRGADIGENVLDGKFVGGVKPTVSSSQGKYRIKLESKYNFYNFLPSFQKEHRLSWNISLNPDLPLKLKLETGASDNVLDFRKTMLKDLRLETGASSTEIILPEKSGQVDVHIESGVASIDITVPEGVAARFKIGGLVGKKINTERFPLVGDYYQSRDYETAENRAYVKIESGVGSIDIH